MAWPPSRVYRGLLTHAGLDDANDGAPLRWEVAGAGRQRARVPEGAGKGRHHGDDHHLPVGGVHAPACVAQGSVTTDLLPGSAPVIMCLHSNCGQLAVLLVR